LKLFRCAGLIGLMMIAALAARADLIYTITPWDEALDNGQMPFSISFRWDSSIGTTDYDIGADESPDGTEHLITQRFAPHSLFDATAVFNGQEWHNVHVQELFMLTTSGGDLVAHITADEGSVYFGRYVYDEVIGLYFDSEMMVLDSTGEEIEYSPGYFSLSYRAVPDSGSAALLFGFAVLGAALIRRRQKCSAISVRI
jgi:hypothetical protein